jgi:drug/metabolite transporter (DMT)-like permease
VTPQGRTQLGSGLALGSAAVFAFNVACVPIVYGDGGNIHAINLVRPLLFLGCIVVWLLARRTSFRLPSTQMAGAVLLGGVMCIEFYAVHAAVAYIPVGLAILVMYTYPLIVAVLDGLLERGRVSWRLLLVLVVAFFGLVLALSGPVETLDWRGIGLGLIAALGMCCLVMISERTMQSHDSGVVMFYIMTSASAVMAALVLADVPLSWPATEYGMLMLAVATVAYVTATSLLFVTVDMIGPVRFALIDNTAPVWATLFGFVMLGEQLILIQWIGMALVIGAVVGLQFLQPPVNTT